MTSRTKAGCIPLSVYGNGPFEAWQGSVFQDDVWRSPALCEALLATYHASASVGDWWSHEARRLHQQLASAMAEAKEQQREIV